MLLLYFLLLVTLFVCTFKLFKFVGKILLGIALVIAFIVLTWLYYNGIIWGGGLW